MAGVRSTRRGGPRVQTLKLFDEVDFADVDGSLLFGKVVAFAGGGGYENPVLPDTFPEDQALIRYLSDAGIYR